MPVQALIFDLDDTLIDTFGQLVPEAHRQACLAMQKAGLRGELEELVKRRWELIKAHPRAEINRLQAEDCEQADPEIIQAGIDAYFNPKFDTLEPFPGVPDLLTRLGSRYPLFLLTSGIPEAQARKVKALNFAPYFQEVLYAPLNVERAKYKALEALPERHDFTHADMVVIGDRIDNEIVAGNALGTRTVWIQQGECAAILPESPLETPDACIKSVLALDKILDQWETPS